MSHEGHARGPHPDADDLPGPDLVAEPAAQGPRHRDGAADDLEARARAASAPRSSTARWRRSASTRRGRRRARPTSSPAGSASASRSPGRSCSTRADHLRRAGVGARRQRAGPGAQPARGPQGEARADADLHRPRPRRRQEHQRPRRRDVPRQAVRGGRRATSCTGRRCTRTRTCCWRRSRCPIRRPDRSQVAVVGEPPSPVLPPPGCRFHPRCPNATDVCTTTEPELRELAAGHFVACHNPVMESPVAVHVTPTAETAAESRLSARSGGGTVGA